LSHINVEEVEGVINRLDLADFSEPKSNVFGGRYQHPMAMIFGLTQNLQKWQLNN